VAKSADPVEVLGVRALSIRLGLGVDAGRSNRLYGVSDIQVANRPDIVFPAVALSFRLGPTGSGLDG
jgi:hypothetical protein